MEILALTISGVSLAISLFIFFRFDCKLKRQEERINAYVIRKHESEELAAKKANLLISALDKPNGQDGTIVIFNEGPSAARNVNIRFNVSEEESWDFMYAFGQPSLPCPLLEAECCLEFSYCDCARTPNRITVIAKWDDDFKESNSKTVTIRLP